jgi:hypothetical protein
MGRVRVSARLWSLVLVLVGLVLVSVGAALAYLPAGFIVGGFGLAAVGLLLVDVKPRR